MSVDGSLHGEKLSGRRNVPPASPHFDNDANFTTVITLLASLFWDLEYCEDAAVTPALELAKLALVTSKDEEEDEDKGGTDSSNDTDATLVEDGPARIPASDQPSVSGPTQGSSMDVDNPRSDKDNVPMRTASPLTNGEASSSKIPAADAAVNKRAPTLPTRKTADVSDSTMMFGELRLGSPSLHLLIDGCREAA